MTLNNNFCADDPLIYISRVDLFLELETHTSSLLLWVLLSWITWKTFQTWPVPNQTLPLPPKFVSWSSYLSRWTLSSFLLIWTTAWIWHLLPPLLLPPGGSLHHLHLNYPSSFLSALPAASCPPAISLSSHFILFHWYQDFFHLYDLRTAWNQEALITSR